MLYQATTRTAIEVVAAGVAIPEDKLQALAGLHGRELEPGSPVEKVAIVFVGGIDEARVRLATIERFGLECRAIDRGRETVLREDTALIPILREEAWPQLGTVACRRLFRGHAMGPWVTFGWDSPETITRFQPRHLGDRCVADIERIAVANLARRSFGLRVLRPGAVGILGEHCSEAILLPDVLRRCADLLGCRLVAVAVPRENMFVAVDAAAIEDVKMLVANARQAFDEATGRRISPVPLLVGGGEIIGFAGAAGDESARKPWYKFW